MPERERLPSWFRQRYVGQEAVDDMEGLLEALRLHTVCESAHCPNVGDCFSRGTATFLIMGNTCTRNCAFCAVDKGKPLPLDNEEPEHLLEAVEKLNLRYVVITSVTRDDLDDGGAGHFARTVALIHEKRRETLVEVLVPDFRGSSEALAVLVGARPEVINHNTETVPRLYSKMRPQADYRRSLALLEGVKKLAPDLVTKSGLMLGVGETRDEVLAVMRDLRDARCDLLTLGQYLPPSAGHHRLERYVKPEEFRDLETIGREMGFAGVAAAPLVRSSFKASDLYARAIAGRGS